jgi:hypothetical protein
LLVEGWIAVAKPGRILFEIAGVNEEVAREALRLASHKLEDLICSSISEVVKSLISLAFICFTTQFFTFYKQIRDLTTSEIEEQIKSSKEELFNLRFQLATGQLAFICFTTQFFTFYKLSFNWKFVTC